MKKYLKLKFENVWTSTRCLFERKKQKRCLYDYVSKMSQKKVLSNTLRDTNRKASAWLPENLMSELNNQLGVVETRNLTFSLSGYS